MTITFGVGMTIFIALLFGAMAEWRRSLFFGVTATPEFQHSEAARAITRGFRLRMAALAAAATAGMVVGVETCATWAIGAVILLEGIGAAALFGWAHGRARPYGATVERVRTAAISAEPERMPGGWPAPVWPLLPLAAAALYVRSNWALVPARFPVHWDLAGQPNGWSSRTFWGVYGPLIIGGLIAGMIAATAAMVLLGTRRGSGGTRRWTQRFRRAALRLLIAVEWGVALTMGCLVAAPVVARQYGVAIPAWIGAALAGVIAVVFTWPLIRISREEGSGTDQTPDNCWKWGIVYYNPDDPALMVERRYGFGYTPNMANPYAWVLAGALGAILAAIALISQKG